MSYLPAITTTLQIERPHHITWRWSGTTQKELPSGECRSLTGDCAPPWPIDIEQLLANVKDQIIVRCYQAIEEEGARQGFNFAITKIEPYSHFVITRIETRQFRDWTYIREYGKLRFGATVQFESDVPISLETPEFTIDRPELFAITTKFVLAVLAFVLAAIVAMYYAPFIRDFLTSLFVNEQEVIDEHITETHTPDCTTVREIERRTDRKREPNILSEIVVPLVIIFGLAVVTPPLMEAIKAKKG